MSKLLENLADVIIKDTSVNHKLKGLSKETSDFRVKEDPESRNGGSTPLEMQHSILRTSVDHGGRRI